MAVFTQNRHRLDRLTAIRAALSVATGPCNKLTLPASTAVYRAGVQMFPTLGMLGSTTMRANPDCLSLLDW
ncbi:MAG TPA: hypothetical protein VJZ70_04685 [Limnochordia bacterium]|nr:hypothetical protein [Limnochordia bacterium]